MRDEEKQQKISAALKGVLKEQGISQARLAEEINFILSPYDHYTTQAVQLWAAGKAVPGFWQMYWVAQSEKAPTWLGDWARSMLAVLRPDIIIPIHP